MAGKKPMGRPSIRTDAVIKKIIEGLSNGVPLTIICSSEDMPSDRTVRSWIEVDEVLSADIARAREAGHDVIAKSAMDIIDAEPERIVSVSEDGSRSVERIDSAAVQWAKNRAWVRLELLKKWDPKRYGDKLDLSSSDGSMTPAREPSYKLVD